MGARYLRRDRTPRGGETDEIRQGREIALFSKTRLRMTALAVGMAVTLGAGLFSGLGPGVSLASSHREAPLTAADPQIDGTDLYAFRSPDRPGTVTFVSNWVPFEE